MENKNNNSSLFSDSDLMDAGACPNCWGRQAYDDQFIQFEKDQTKDNINHQNKKAFIQQFVESHITGIQLKQEGIKRVCPSCKTSF